MSSIRTSELTPDADASRLEALSRRNAMADDTLNFWLKMLCGQGLAQSTTGL
jgi:hypothetical protein